MCFGSLSSNVEILAITKKWLEQKWLYLWNYREFCSAENFVGILGIHLPCLDASQTLIGPEGAAMFIPNMVYFLWTRNGSTGPGTGPTGI